MVASFVNNWFRSNFNKTSHLWCELDEVMYRVSEPFQHACCQYGYHHSPGLISDIATSTSNNKKRKKCDIKRHDFSTLLLEKYSSVLLKFCWLWDNFAEEKGKAQSHHMPDHLFTKHLPSLGWTLVGAEGIERVRDIHMKQMEELTRGLNDGSVYFTDYQRRDMDEEVWTGHHDKSLNIVCIQEKCALIPLSQLWQLCKDSEIIHI